MENRISSGYDLKERVDLDFCLLSRDQMIDLICNMIQRESELISQVKELMRELGRVA